MPIITIFLVIALIAFIITMMSLASAIARRLNFDPRECNYKPSNPLISLIETGQKQQAIKQIEHETGLEDKEAKWLYEYICQNRRKVL